MNKHQRKVYQQAVQRVGKWFHGVDLNNPLTATEIAAQLEGETRICKEAAIWRQKEYGI